jgi:hypothetical protein
MKSELDTALENLSELSSRINMWSDDMRICGMKQLIINPLLLLKKWKAAAEFAESANTFTNSQSDVVCPKSAVLEVSGVKICINDGEPCVGTPGSCFDDK